MNIDPILLEGFAARFVNRQDAYGRQYLNEDGKCVYTAVYCQRQPWVLADVIRGHVINSSITIGICALDERGYCRWCCFDGDDNSGKIDKIERLLTEHHWHTVAEGARQDRDGHLWMFFSQPILAADLRLFMRHIVKSAGIESMDNLELFPKQDMPNWDNKRRLFLASSFVKLPLCFHLKSKSKLWFRDAPRNLDSQLKYICSQPFNPITPVQKAAQELRMLEAARNNARRRPVPKRMQNVNNSKIDFTRYAVDNYFEQHGNELIGPCPSCRDQGHDTDDNHLNINIEKNVVHCWRDCNIRSIVDAIKNAHAKS